MRGGSVSSRLPAARELEEMVLRQGSFKLDIRIIISNV